MALESAPWSSHALMHLISYSHDHRQQMHVAVYDGHASPAASTTHEASIARLMQAFGQVATQESVPEGVRKRVAGTVAHMQATQGPQVGSVLQQLPPDQRGALADLTNHRAA